MPREKPIVPIKSYGEQIPVPRIILQLPTLDERLRESQARNSELKYELDCALDRIRRLREVVKWEVEFWQDGLKNGEWSEGPTALRRRMSRLAGALEYHGLPGGAKWAEKER